MRREITERGTLVDAFKSDDGGEYEDEGEKKGEEENGVEQRSVREVACCDLDLHQIEQASGTTGRRYSDASNSQREPNLHSSSTPSPSTSTFSLPHQERRCPRGGVGGDNVSK